MKSGARIQNTVAAGVSTLVVEWIEIVIPAVAIFSKYVSTLVVEWIEMGQMNRDGTT